MSINLEYGHPAAGWQIKGESLTVFLPVSFLAGSAVEVLYPEPMKIVGSGVNWVRADNAGFVIFIGKASVGNDVETATVELYKHLLSATSTGQILRIWNYVPRINEWDSGDENYRSFCSGRARAFATGVSSSKVSYPSASAVSCNGRELIVIGIAAKAGAACHFENPLQCPAYQYPPQYGLKAPTFSRATIWAEGRGLYVSGTSSVSGHQTVHPLNLAGQLRVTAQNTHSIIAEAQTSGAEIAPPRPYWLKAYVRNAHDLSDVEAWLARENWLVEDRFSIVQADICRRELLIEIELSWLAIDSQTVGTKLDPNTLINSPK